MCKQLHTCFSYAVTTVAHKNGAYMYDKQKWAVFIDLFIDIWAWESSNTND